MTYNVFGGTLNLAEAQVLNISIYINILLLVFYYFKILFLAKQQSYLGFRDIRLIAKCNILSFT